jgi:two-component system sensor kinase FixL
MQNGQRAEVTHSIVDPGGRVSETVLIVYPIKSGKGAFDYFMEIAWDVTEYREMIKKLQVSEKRFRAILDTATDAIVSMDENGKIMLFNNAAQGIFGYPRKEILGRDFGKLIPAQQVEDYRFLTRCLQGRGSGISEKTMSLNGLRSNGEEFPIEMGISFLELDAGITYTAIIRDVSGQRQLERKLLQSERFAAVGQAAAHVAHELRNPLMIIGGFSTQVLRSLSEVKTRQKMELILEEVERLERLVEEMGDFTREYRLVKRPADINLVVRDVVKIMAEIYTEGQYRFEECLSSDLEEIHCDPDKVKQVLINIISNGIEAMPGGGIITLKTETIPDGAEISVSDEGTGMAGEELQHIFEPFYTTRVRGSGLGLAICYRIIEAHKGDLFAASSPGEGTTFTIRLPAT